VTADILGQRVNGNIGAVIKHLAQIGRGDGVVHHQRHPVAMGNGGERLDIHHIASRVADGFTKQGAGVVVDQRLKACVIIKGRHPHFYTLRWKGVGKEIIGAAVELSGTDNIVTGAGDALDGGSDGGHA